MKQHNLKEWLPLCNMMARADVERGLILVKRGFGALATFTSRCRGKNQSDSCIEQPSVMMSQLFLINAYDNACLAGTPLHSVGAALTG